jgi:hypothetical protein
MTGHQSDPAAQRAMLTSSTVRSSKTGPTAEQASQFKDLLADNIMKTTEKSSSLMEARPSPIAPRCREAVRNRRISTKGRGLGETAYAQYRDYQQTVGERTQLSQFQQQNASSEHPLTDQQSETLAFMKEEKQAVAAQRSAVAGDNCASCPNASDVLWGRNRETAPKSGNDQRVYAHASEVLRRTVEHFRNLPDQSVSNDAHGHDHGAEVHGAEKLKCAAPSSRP